MSRVSLLYCKRQSNKFKWLHEAQLQHVMWVTITSALGQASRTSQKQ